MTMAQQPRSICRGLTAVRKESGEESIIISRRKGSAVPSMDEPGIIHSSSSRQSHGNRAKKSTAAAVTAVILRVFFALKAHISATVAPSTSTET